jgi:hypothetical protein
LTGESGRTNNIDAQGKGERVARVVCRVGIYLVFKPEDTSCVLGTPMEQSSPANSEWLTRKQLIDKELRAAGWKATPYHEGVALSRLDRCAIEEYPWKEVFGQVWAALRC